MGGAIGVGISTMLASRGLDTDREARQFARQQQFEKSWDKIAKDSDRTTSAADKFQQRMQLIERGEFAPAGMGGLLGRMAAGFEPEITADQAAAARFEAVEELKKAVGESEFKMAPSALAGTSEAQDIINRSMQGQTDKLEQVRNLLEQANKMAEDRKKAIDANTKALNDLKGKGGLIVGKKV